MAEQVITPPAKGKSQSAGKWVLQVDLGWDENASGVQVENWKSMFGMNSFQPNFTYTEQPDDDFDSDGWDSSQTTGQGWNLAVGARRKKYAGVYDVVQEFLRRAAFARRKVRVRWFDRKHGDEAYAGVASVKWEPQSGSRTDLETVNVTLTGDGAPDEIANPHNAIPTITTVDPATAPAGATVTLTGTGFWSVSAVKFGGTDATSFSVDSTEKKIRAVVPAGATGAATVTVTNPMGTSTAATFSRTA